MPHTGYGDSTQNAEAGTICAMPDNHLNVLHVVGGDTPTARLDTLRALCARSELGYQRVVRIGAGDVDCAGLGKVERILTPLGVGWLARRSLESVLPSSGRMIVHIWSTKALEWVLPAVKSDACVEARGGADYRLLMDVELPLDFGRLARGFSWLWSEGRMRLVCSTETARSRLLGAGISPNACVLIRDSVDFAAINAARGSDVGLDLGLSNDDAVALVLPPVLRGTGALLAAWASMLVAQVRPDLRLVVPGGGKEASRVVRMVEACRHEWILRQVDRRVALCDLLAASDLAVYLPTEDVSLTGLIWALAAGTPIVASAIPVTTELLAHGHNAWLCRANDPKDAARRMLQALENREQSQQQALLARSRVFGLFGRQRMIEQYRRVYENLLADRCASDGIEGNALIR
jgi:hypothetical protein